MVHNPDHHHQNDRLNLLNHFESGPSEKTNQLLSVFHLLRDEKYQAQLF